MGLIATVADLLTLFVLVDGAGLAPRAANVPALLVGIVAQFVGNKLLAFRDRSPAWLAQGVRFALIEVGALALNAGLFHLLADALPYVAARVVTSAAVYFLYSYPLWGRIFAVPAGGQ